MIKCLLSASLLALLVSTPAFAATHYVASNTLLLYTESTNGTSSSNGHIVVSNQTLSGCSGKALYIDPNDKQLFADVLTGVISNKSIKLEYEDSPGSSVTAVGVGTVGCKLVTVWW